MYIVVLLVKRFGTSSASRCLFHNHKTEDYIDALDLAEKMAKEHSLDIDSEKPVAVVDGFMFMSSNYTRCVYAVEKLEES